MTGIVRHSKNSDGRFRTREEEYWPRACAFSTTKLAPHIARQTVALLDQFGWDIITHPHYSPDLAPCDYHLFPKLKERLAGRRFSDDDEVNFAVQRFLNVMAANWYDMGIQKLPLRLQKCIDRNGDYVET